MHCLTSYLTTPGAHIAEIELARSRVHSATEMLKLLPQLNDVPVPQPAHKEESAKMAQQVVEVQTDAKPEVVDDVKAEVKAEHKPEVKAEVKAQAKTGGEGGSGSGERQAYTRRQVQCR